MEDTRCDETSKRRGKDVSGVKNSNTGSNLFSGVEDREEIDSTGVVGSFRYTKEESGEEQTSKVLGDSGEGTDNSPESHHGALDKSVSFLLTNDRPNETMGRASNVTYHVATRSGSSEKHVGGDLPQNVTNEKDRHAGLVF